MKAKLRVTQLKSTIGVPERFRTALEILVPAQGVPKIVPALPILGRRSYDMLQGLDCSRIVSELVGGVSAKTRQPKRGISKGKLPRRDLERSREIVLPDERRNQVGRDPDIIRAAPMRDFEMADGRFSVAEIGLKHAEHRVEGNRVATRRKRPLNYRDCARELPRSRGS